MRYSYEFKKACIEMYRQGILPDIPEGISKKEFQRYIRRWMRMEDAQGSDVLKHSAFNKQWTPEEKLELVTKALCGKGIQPTAIEAGINAGMLYQWVRKYKIYGYNGLVPKQKGRKSQNADMKKVGTRKPPKPNESEYEELIRLRAENEYMKAEIEVIKKEIALREEKEAARLKAKKQQSSKNSEKTDTN